MSSGNEFPTILYKGVGPHQRLGGTYDYIGANNAEEKAQRLKEGWFETLPEAIAAHDNPETKATQKRKGA